jgi:hypothetical protein
MKRALVTAATVLLLALPLAGCRDDDSGAAAAPGSSDSSTPAAAVDAEAAKDLPALAPELPTAPPTAPPKALAPGGASFDACTAVPPDLVTEAFGVQPGQALPQESSLGDPDAGDCFYFSNDFIMVAEGTADPDQYMPEEGYSYAGLPGAEEVPDADRGWAYILPGQDAASGVVAGLILVKGDRGLSFSISVANHPYDMEVLQAFAAQVVTAMDAA